MEFMRIHKIDSLNLSVLDNIDMALIEEGVNYPHCKNPSDYLNNKISYKLDNLKLEAMNLFLQKI